MSEGPTPEVEPLAVDGVRAVLVGTALWLAALIVLLLLHHQLAARGAQWWIWTTLAGALFGLPGLWFVLRRRAAYRREG